MKIFIYALIFVLGPMPGIAQENNLSPQARSLLERYRQLEQNPDNLVLQHHYVLHFPHTVSDFDTLFDAADFSELYDGYLYINMLKKLIPDYPMLTGCILLNIAKDSRWQADAFSYLQGATAFFALEHTDEFIDILNSYDTPEQNAIITFLADGDHAPVKEFDDIVKKLGVLDEQEIADRFLSINKAIKKQRAVIGN